MIEIFSKIKSVFKKKEKIEEIDFTELGLFERPFNLNDTNLLLHNLVKDKNKKTKDRIPKRPMDIIHEIEQGVEFPMIKIKEAIKELEFRIKFMKETLHADNREEIRALDMLKAREKYPKYASLFKWKTTTLRHITLLMGKYKLDHKDISLFVRSIPHDAITCMQIYSEVLSKVSDKRPKFSLIAPPSYFHNPKNQTDPILLAESPFGEFYYILCAWDKEISMVSELLDGEELVIENGDKN